jgi:predicted MFS family arabinose efflux permease
VALTIWALTLVPLLVRERLPEELAARRGRRLDLQELARTFSAPAMWVALAAAVLVPLGYGLLATPFQFLLRDHLHWSKEAIGLLTSVVDPLVGIAGSLTGGFLADRFGARRVMVVASLLMAASMAVLGACPGSWTGGWFLYAWYAVHFIIQYLFGAGLLAFFMALANPAIGATHIGIFFALNNLCYTFCDWAGGALLAWASRAGAAGAAGAAEVPTTTGYAITFLVCAVAQVLVLLPLVACDPERIRSAYMAPAKESP